MDRNTKTLLSILLLTIADVASSSMCATSPSTAVSGPFAMLDLYVRRALAAVVLLRVITRITTDLSLDIAGLVVAGLCYTTSRLWGTAGAAIILCGPLLWFLACHIRVHVRIRWAMT